MEVTKEDAYAITMCIKTFFVLVQTCPWTRDALFSVLQEIWGMPRAVFDTLVDSGIQSGAVYEKDGKVFAVDSQTLAALGEMYRQGSGAAAPGMMN